MKRSLINLKNVFRIADERRKPVLYSQRHVVMGSIRTGSPDQPSYLFYNQVIFYIYDAINAACNLSGLCNALLRIDKTA